jgi:hypothetical protein
MTREEINDLLRQFQVLGLVVGAMIKEPDKRENCWFQLERACGRRLKEYLLVAEPDEDPVLYLQALQALEALKEDQVWLRRISIGQGAPSSARWQ